MKIAIIEDEPYAGKSLSKLIKTYDSAAEILPIADSVASAVALLSHNTPDLIFLDIELADGISFEIFDQVKVNAPIIFTTAYDQYTLRAFSVNSVAYLLKPIGLEKLVEAFDKYNQMKKAFNVKVMTDTIHQVAQSISAYKQHFLVKSGNKQIQIHNADIAYFKASERWVILVTTSHQQYIVSYNLAELEELLDPKDFFRINRKFLVRRHSIEYLEPYFKGQVCVKLKHEDEGQIISRKTTPLLKEWLAS